MDAVAERCLPEGTADDETLGHVQATHIQELLMGIAEWLRELAGELDATATAGHTANGLNDHQNGS